VEIIELENEKLTGTLVALEGVCGYELCGVIFLGKQKKKVFFVFCFLFFQEDYGEGRTIYFVDLLNIYMLNVAHLSGLFIDNQAGIRDFYIWGANWD